MASRRDAIRMSDPEVAAYLDAGRTLVLATQMPDGTSHLSAMWYAVDDDGTPLMWTYAASQKTRNLERDPRVTGLVEGGTTYADLTGVMLKGHAELSRDLDAVVRVGRLLAQRYGGGADLDPDAIARQGAKRVAVRFVVERVVSWDHRKLGGTY